MLESDRHLKKDIHREDMKDALQDKDTTSVYLGLGAMAQDLFCYRDNLIV